MLKWIFKNVMNFLTGEIIDENEGEEIKCNEGQQYINLAQTEEEAERLFNIAFYCHHSMEKYEMDKLKQEWREYKDNAKKNGTPMLPYYRYILEKIEFKLKK